MTLVITELSPIGIVMAADSTITKFDPTTRKIIETDQRGWEKLLRVPSIKAAISYWGMVGAITQKQFDLWLKENVISKENYYDLPSFADYLAKALNDACQNKPLQSGFEIGIHVAGYSEWEDGQKRPVFFHVHNGHATTKISHEHENGQLKAVHLQWEAEPRKLFEKHQDFPKLDKTFEENLNIQLYTTRNGEYFIYSIISQSLSEAIDYINHIPKLSIPRNPDNLLSRKGYIHFSLQTIINIYRLSNMSKIVGGEVKSLAIGPEGYVGTVES